MSELETLLATAARDISAAADVRALEEVRVRLLGRKGEVTGLLEGLARLAPDARQRAVGAEQMQAELTAQRVDVT